MIHVFILSIPRNVLDKQVQAFVDPTSTNPCNQVMYISWMVNVYISKHYIYISLPVWSSHLCQGNVHNITAIVCVTVGLPTDMLRKAASTLPNFLHRRTVFRVNGIGTLLTTKDGPCILQTQTKTTSNNTTVRFLIHKVVNQSIIYQPHLNGQSFLFNDYPDPKTTIEWKPTYCRSFPFPAAIQMEGKLWRSWPMINGFRDVSQAWNR